jgi:hypothetical protein
MHRVIRDDHKPDSKPFRPAMVKTCTFAVLPFKRWISDKVLTKDKKKKKKQIVESESESESESDSDSDDENDNQKVNKCVKKVFEEKNNVSRKRLENPFKKK